MNGFHTIALAVVTSDRRPIVSPVGTVLWHGDFAIPTVLSSTKARLIMRQPNVGLTYYEEEHFAVLVQGTASVIQRGSPRFDDLDAFLVDRFEESTEDWGGKGEGAFLIVRPHNILSYRTEPKATKESDE